MAFDITLSRSRPSSRRDIRLIAGEPASNSTMDSMRCSQPAWIWHCSLACRKDAKGLVMDAAQPIIELIHTTRLYGKVIGVNDLNVELPKGAYGLVGPNGAGKSTLIGLITGALRPTLGSGLKSAGCPRACLSWRSPRSGFFRAMEVSPD